MGIKIAIGFLGFLYVLYILLKVEHVVFKISEAIGWTSFWKQTFAKFLVITIITSLFVYCTNQSLMFHVILHKPLLWIFIIFIYTLLSVYPQELIYRTFYFKRYQKFFKNRKLLIISNAFVFSLAHIFFRNYLVWVLTLLGGFLFAMTYYKTQSTLLVSIEHALYGCGLFTLGMGEMLGFPT